MKRRNFVAGSSLAAMGLGLLNKEGFGFITSQVEPDHVRAYLKKILYTRDEIDAWFAGSAFPFSKYNSELGWLLNSDTFQDGLNNTWSVYTYEGEDGPRIMNNYRDKPCRINSYGNSFTQCHQVSDHETWQELLAGHLQEPVRNFGIGGWSVYQAYLRMLKEEKRTPAKYLIFNIYGDDHLRNLDSWRNIRANKHPQHIESTLPFLKIDLEKQIITECKNPCPTRESFYKLCDIDETYKLFKDDFVLKIMIAHQQSKQTNPSKNYESLMQLSKTHGIETRIESNDTLSEVADKIHRQAGLFSTQKIVEKIEEYAKLNQKEVLYVLSYPSSYIGQYIAEGSRWDQPFIDFLNNNKLPYIDLAQSHREDYKAFKLNIKEYLARYFIGHYSPPGNFFCAHSLRDKVVGMIEPRPLPYRLKPS
jgi:hypothetical protein